MSTFSLRIFQIATALGFLALLYLKGLPTPPTPNPDAFVDVLLQPVLATIWALVGYFLNAMIFALIVIFAIKIARALFEFLSNGPSGDRTP